MYALKNPDENLDGETMQICRSCGIRLSIGSPPREADQPTLNFFVNEVLHFADCCRTGKEPTSSGRDNIESMKVVFAINESSRTGRAVDLADL